MEPAVRGPWIKSAITAGRVQNDALLPPRLPKFQPPGIGRQNRTTGNGIFRCRDRRPKSQPERPQVSPETERLQRYLRKSPRKRPIRTRRMDLRFRRTGWWRRYGSNCQLPTQSSNPSLTPESGTEIFDAETGGRNGLIRGDCRSRDCANQRIWQTCL